MQKKARPPEREAELNIVPYLDIIVNLVMFMLVSMSGFIMFQMINTNTPDVETRGGVPPPEPKDKLTITLAISTHGYNITATGAGLLGIVPNIPLKSGTDGPPDYDYSALTERMTAIHRQYPDVSNYLMTADKPVKYDVIIRTLDATRGGSGAATLFPDVTFAALM